MKAEIDTLHVECPLCGDDITVPVMVDHGTHTKRVTVTLEPDFTGLRAHAQGHLATPERGQPADKWETRCAHGIRLSLNCPLCEGTVVSS